MVACRTKRKGKARKASQSNDLVLGGLKGVDLSQRRWVGTPGGGPGLSLLNKKKLASWGVPLPTSHLAGAPPVVTEGLRYHCQVAGALKAFLPSLVTQGA